TTYAGERFHPETIRVLASDATTLGRAAGAVVAIAAAAGYRGLVLDFEGLGRDDLDPLLIVVRAITDSARAHGVAPVAVAVPAADTAAYPARALAGVADLVMPMLYDEHWSTSPPGPIASPEFVRHWLGVRIGEVGAARIVAALPLYGYQWRSDSAAAV